VRVTGTISVGAAVAKSILESSQSEPTLAGGHPIQSRWPVADVRYLFYPDSMPELDEKLTPADPDDLAAAFAFALKFEGRKRWHDADAFMADIVAKRLVRYLDRAGYVVMKRPASGGSGDNSGRRSFEGKRGLRLPSPFLQLFSATYLRYNSKSEDRSKARRSCNAHDLHRDCVSARRVCRVCPRCAQAADC
jgi:hypothetical protein